jgi:glutathionylspermidine synthase
MSTITQDVAASVSEEQKLHPIRAGATLEHLRFSPIRRELLLKFCKWDPQVGDISTLAPFPLLMEKRRWNGLETLAERLTAELLAAERELLERHDLHAALAIPRALRRVLRRANQLQPAPSAVRVMRFDFHWTESGWQISEVNADVPGGFSEASEFTRLMSEACTGTTTPGNPAQLWAESMAAVVSDRPVALLVAAGFMEDQQIVSYLARVLRERGIDALLAGPQQLQWKSGWAYLNGRPLGAVVRFYQAEWLSHLPRRCEWPRLLIGGRTPVSNTASCIFGESKRFPLVWDRLRSKLPTWRQLLPETRDPRDAPWKNDDSWLIKTAWCNTGDTVSARTLCTPPQWRSAYWSAVLRPGEWIAQRRFEPAPVASPIGAVYPCLGVYTINGRACGAYTRISTGRVIDHRAVDIALLLRETADEF